MAMEYRMAWSVVFELFCKGTKKNEDLQAMSINMRIMKNEE